MAGGRYSQTWMTSSRCPARAACRAAHRRACTDPGDSSTPTTSDAGAWPECGFAFIATSPKVRRGWYADMREPPRATRDTLSVSRSMCPDERPKNLQDQDVCPSEVGLP